MCYLLLSSGLSLTSVTCFWAMSFQSLSEDTLDLVMGMGFGLISLWWQKPLSLGLWGADWKAVLKVLGASLKKNRDTLVNCHREQNKPVLCFHRLCHRCRFLMDCSQDAASQNTKNFLYHTHTHTHTHTLTHTLTHTHTHTHTHSLSLSLCLSHTHTHTLSLSLSLCLSLSHTHTHTHTLSLSLSLSVSLTHTLTRTHTLYKKIYIWIFF